jgi:hypothetical protein
VPIHLLTETKDIDIPAIIKAIYCALIAGSKTTGLAKIDFNSVFNMHTLSGRNALTDVYRRTKDMCV